MDRADSPLLTDLYQLNMVQAYLEHGKTGTAVFEFFMRRLPGPRGFLVAAGLEQALDFLQRVHFTASELAWLRSTGRFSEDLVSYLAGFRFTGDVHAIAEGTVVFPDEPILRITAPLPEAQLVESRLINILHFQTLIASKAARHVLVAPDRLLMDFGFRRAHGAEAGVFAARASYIAGYEGTATVLAGELYGIPIYGTMAHSFIQAFDDEMAAFEAFAASRPDGLIVLIDTYDTEQGAHKVVELAGRLRGRGIEIRGVRLDSGDIAVLSRRVRSILDAGGLQAVRIFASGGLDEDDIVAFARAGAPVDGYGIGTSLTTSADVPSLDCAYKLQEYDGIGRRKKATGKATWPGRKQVWRQRGGDGRMARDVLSLESDRHEGETLVAPVMAAGKLIAPHPSLASVRARAAAQLAGLPEPLRQLQPGSSYPVDVAPALLAYTQEVESWLAGPQR